MSDLKKKHSKIINSIIIIFIIAVFVAAGIIFMRKAFARAKEASENTFSKVYEKTKQDTYDKFKQQAFEYFEHENHVKNRGTITIGNIKEENLLEVLSVSDSWVKISDPNESNDNTTRWVEFNATGVYTVDMNVSEFIIDDYNNFVLVKLKTPQLNHVALDDSSIEIYNYDYETGFLKINGDYKKGTEMAIDDRAEALSKLTEQLENNDENLSKAKISAENLIKTFIKNVNTDIILTDNDIQVEFI